MVGRWFSPLRSGNSPALPKKVLLDDKLYFNSSEADESTNLQIVKQCRHIHYTLLNEVDPHLARYLKDLQIEPHLYMLRWVRIMLAQVFQLPDLLLLWDGIFAFGRDVALLDWLCVAMLVNIRHTILGQDYSICMSRLFNYPQGTDVRLLVATAQRLYQKYQTQRTISMPKAQDKAYATPPITQKVNTVTRTQTKSPTPQTQNQSNVKRSPPTQRAAPQPPAPQFLPALLTDTPQMRPVAPQKPKTSAFKGIFNEDELYETNEELLYLRQESQVLRQETAGLRNTAAHMSNRLERVLYILGAMESSAESEEALQSAIAELTDVKGILAEASQSKQQETIQPQPHKPSPTLPRQQSPTPQESNVKPASPVPQQQENRNNQPRANSPVNYYEKLMSMDPFSVFKRNPK